MTSTDLAVPDFASEVERATDPGAFVVRALERAKSWLNEALEHGEIDAIVELKSQAEAIRAYTMSKQLGHDAQVAAQEIVRRAERGIGLAVRKGQQAGEIRRAGDSGGRPKTGTGSVRVSDGKKSPYDFFPNRQEMTEAYAMAGPSDEQFERVLSVAKAEHNVTRANVARISKSAAETGTVRPVAPGRGAARVRRAYPEAFRDATTDVVKAVERLVRLVTVDDRFMQYAQQVADNNRHHINRARDLLVDVASRMPGREKG